GGRHPAALGLRPPDGAEPSPFQSTGTSPNITLNQPPTMPKRRVKIVGASPVAASPADPGALGLEFCSGSVRGAPGAGREPTQGNVRAAAAVEVFRAPTPEPRAI